MAENVQRYLKSEEELKKVFKALREGPLHHEDDLLIGSIVGGYGLGLKGGATIRFELSIEEHPSTPDVRLNIRPELFATEEQIEKLLK